MLFGFGKAKKDTSHKLVANVVFLLFGVGQVVNSQFIKAFFAENRGARVLLARKTN